jgi:hypothetical protein
MLGNRATFDDTMITKVQSGEHCPVRLTETTIRGRGHRLAPPVDTWQGVTSCLLSPNDHKVQRQSYHIRDMLSHT